MVPYLPKQISSRAILVYLISLALVSLVYFDYAMSFRYVLLGILFVCGFFLLGSKWTKGWGELSEKKYVRNLFLAAVVLRIIWVFLSYFFYMQMTGMPFEFEAADAMGYHEEAVWLAGEPWSTTWEYYFGPESLGISDIGYPLYLTLLYKIFGTGVILPRLIKALLSAWMCILVYRLAARTFDEKTGRMAGILCCLMPNLIIYCGYHLKETEMLFLEVAFLERLDYLIRSRRVTVGTILVPSLLAGSLFFFRTVLGAAAVFTFATAALFSNTQSMQKGLKRALIVSWGVLCAIFISGGTIMTEIEGYWEERDDNLTKKRVEQTSRGNQWAQYATGAVMAPIVVALPFATMVDVDQQYGQQEKHGGNYIRNFMGLFAILAIYEAFRRKKWRDYLVIGAFVVSYLGVVSLSGFANAERFLLPGLPCLIMMWSYGIATLRPKTYKWLTPWCIIVFLMEFGWAFFKLGSRGMF